MAIFVLTDAVILAHDQDLSGISNKVTLKATVDERDVSTFGQGGYRAKLGGLKMVSLDVNGFQDSAAAPDAAAFAALGVADRAYTVSAANVVGQPAYLFQAGEFAYDQGDAVGNAAPFTAQSKGTNAVGVARGQLAKTKGVVSATGVLGSGVNLGAGGTGKFLYATLHVIGTPGTTVTVIVQSDTTSGFGAPTTRATIGPITTAGGTFMTRVNAAAITDTWWRFNVSVITGSFTLAGALALQ
jgi:hypothetical protein